MRHLIFPVLLAAAIIVPALVNKDSWFQNADRSPGATAALGTASTSGMPLAPFSNTNLPVNLSPENLSGGQRAGQNTAQGITYPISTVPVAPTNLTFNQNPAQLSLTEVMGPSAVPPQWSSSAMPPTINSPLGSAISDIGRGQTVILPGNAFGPDLSATPMEFLPTSNLGDIIRFDIGPNWVRSRWQRISTSPEEYGLHGLRIPLVTGVNPSDLHGSLTYYFDERQIAQRIAFRGWTGDPSRLVNLMVENYGLTRQPTHWAGFYLAHVRWKKLTAALLLQHPEVIRSDNPAEQIAVMLEINNPQGPFSLSDELKSLCELASEAK